MVARTSTVLCSAIRKVTGRRLVLISTYLGINRPETFKLSSGVTYGTVLL